MEEVEAIIAQVVWQDWAHHVGAPWIENIGGWCVFPANTLAYGWPHNGMRLVLEMSESQLISLRESNTPSPEINPLPLPSNVPPPAPIPSAE